MRTFNIPWFRLWSHHFLFPTHPPHFRLIFPQLWKHRYINHAYIFTMHALQQPKHSTKEATRRDPKIQCDKSLLNAEQTWQRVSRGRKVQQKGRRNKKKKRLSLNSKHGICITHPGTDYPAKRGWKEKRGRTVLSFPISPLGKGRLPRVTRNPATNRKTNKRSGNAIKSGSAPKTPTPIGFSCPSDRPFVHFVPQIEWNNFRGRPPR